MRACTDYVRTSVAKYRDRIHAWDVVNELHSKNELELSKDQLLELTGAALQAAREADPTCFRLINNCCPWCEYLAREVPLGKQSIYDYLTMVRGAGIDYEAIGLQYYYYGRDLLEIERSLETFADFGKPIHITELGTPSSSEEIQTGWPNGVRFPWHGERWSGQSRLIGWSSSTRWPTPSHTSRPSPGGISWTRRSSPTAACFMPTSDQRKATDG